MSGKSTVMRAVLIAALLANCGLYSPVSQASVPRYDNYFLRTASYDIPSEGKSAFALEMDDMRVITRDCTEFSLVMIDELGKGTSARDGSALAGALLEYLDAKQCSGIFATHLHELFRLPLHLGNVCFKRMGIRESAEGRKKWTYQLLDGQCTDSLALVTAKEYEIPSEIIRRAQELTSYYDSHFKVINDSTSPLSSANTEQPGIDTEEEDRGTTRKSKSVRRFTLESDLVHVLEQTAKACRVPSPLRMAVLDHNYTPPPSFEGSSVVYIMHISFEKSPDLCYVGETESIRQRLQQHRQTLKLPPSARVRTVVLCVQNKSIARAVESVLIRELKQLGIDIEQDTDARHNLFSLA